jgi:hypothetical protein
VNQRRARLKSKKLQQGLLSLLLITRSSTATWLASLTRKGTIVIELTKRMQAKPGLRHLKLVLGGCAVFQLLYKNGL